MIFYEGSPRRCSPAEAQVIAAAMRRRVELCGVFVNAPLQEIVRDSEELGLSLIQLHGDEGPSFCAEVARRTGARVIKAAQVSGSGDVQDLERFHVDFHLLDARAKAVARQGMRGGTGETFDWGLVSARRSNVPLILSGGLSAENVADALAGRAPVCGGYARAARRRRRGTRIRRSCTRSFRPSLTRTPSRRRSVSRRERGRAGRARRWSIASGPTAGSSCPRR